MLSVLYSDVISQINKSTIFYYLFSSVTHQTAQNALRWHWQQFTLGLQLHEQQ